MYQPSRSPIRSSDEKLSIVPRVSIKTFGQRSFQYQIPLVRNSLQHTFATQTILLFSNFSWNPFSFEKPSAKRPLSTWHLCGSVLVAVVSLVETFSFSVVYSVVCFCMLWNKWMWFKKKKKTAIVDLIVFKWKVRCCYKALWAALLNCVTEKWYYYSLLLIVPAGPSSCGGVVAVYVFDTNQRSLPTPFYSVLVSVSVIMALSTAFHFINSLDKSPRSHSVFPVSFLP